jgi:hypothetical protein
LTIDLEFTQVDEQGFFLSGQAVGFLLKGPHPVGIPPR